jgi:putative hydrolase of the HAD superfamily
MLDLTCIRAILFDVGGTLLDAEQPESYSYLRDGVALAHRHLCDRLEPPPLRRYRRAYMWWLARAYMKSRLTRTEMNTPVEIRRFHRKMGIDLDDTLFDEISRLLYRPMIALAHAHPGTTNALAALRDRRFRLGVISNTIAPPQGLDDHLTAEGLIEYLPMRVYSCEVGVPKPNPRIFRAALDRIGTPANQTLYVGDRPRIDVRGAAAVGMRTVLRTAPGMTRRRGPMADLDIRQIEDLLEYFPSLITS